GMPGTGASSPAPGPATGTAPFGARLAAAVAARESQIVLGIDPDPAKLWPAPAERIAEARAALAATLGVEALEPAVEAAVGADAVRHRRRPGGGRLHRQPAARP